MVKVSNRTLFFSSLIFLLLTGSVWRSVAVMRMFVVSPLSIIGLLVVMSNAVMYAPLISGLLCCIVMLLLNRITSYSCSVSSGIFTVSPSIKSSVRSNVSILSVVSSRILTSPYRITVKCSVYVAYCVAFDSLTVILLLNVSSVMSIPLSTIEALVRSKVYSPYSPIILQSKLRS